MNSVSPQTLYLLTLLKLKGVGPAALKRAVLLPGFDRMGLEALASAVPQIARSLEAGANWQEAQDWAHAQVVEADRHSARILSAVDEEYPTLLAATKDDPFIIYVQGVLARPEQRSVAVIGTREPTQHGALVARRITAHFGEAGWSIVSGLAIGCDGLAHQAALDCGAHTVAVMAHGLHMTAPSKHKSLAQAILASGGALVSEYPFGQAVQNQQYVKRDRTQAGMALGVVMVQSDLKGGSLYASRAALEYGRWLAVPYPTQRDMDNKEPKVQANLVIAEAAPHERADLLRSPVSSLERVIVLRSKEDYWRLADSNGVEPFTPGETLTSMQGIVANDSREAKGVTVDFFSRPIPELESAPLEAAGRSDSLSTVDNFNVIEGGAEYEIQAPGFEHTDASASDPVLREVVPTPESSDTPSRERTLQPHSVFPAYVDEPPEIASVQTPGAAEFSQPVAASHASTPKTETLHRSVYLEVSLPSDKDVAAAFGLWLPPKIGSKDFKKWLGGSADDGQVREFYARHRRLHMHLIDLQRKLADAKRPRTHDQVILLRLVSEEVIFQLSKLADATVGIEARSKAERQRIQKEDWIAQDEAENQPLNLGGQPAVTERRSKVIAETAALLSAGLKSIVIGDGDSDSFKRTGDSEMKRLSLSELVERLNSVLLSTL